MTTPEQQRATQPRTSEDSESLAFPIGMLMLAMLFGAGSLTLTVFGVWPAAVLVLASAALAFYAVKRIRRYDATTNRR
jgi:hypothetical protein